MNNEINLQVCTECDAPLPKDKSLNYFNNNQNICDECFKILNNEN